MLAPPYSSAVCERGSGIEPYCWWLGGVGGKGRRFQDISFQVMYIDRTRHAKNDRHATTVTTVSPWIEPQGRGAKMSPLSASKVGRIFGDGDDNAGGGGW